MKWKCTVSNNWLIERESALISAIKVESGSVKFCFNVAVNFHFIAEDCVSSIMIKQNSSFFCKCVEMQHGHLSPYYIVKIFKCLQGLGMQKAWVHGCQEL